MTKTVHTFMQTYITYVHREKEGERKDETNGVESYH